MWLIFIISAILVFCGVMMAFWITNKLLISMRRDNHKYELEIKNEKTEGEEAK